MYNECLYRYRDFVLCFLFDYCQYILKVHSSTVLKGDRYQNGVKKIC